MDDYGALSEPTISSGLLSFVAQGRVFSLSYPIDAGGPLGTSSSTFSILDDHSHEDWIVDGPFGEATEIFSMSGHTGTHVDALCHISEKIDGERVLYGGVSVADAKGEQGFSRLGIERCPPVVARGILVDVARFMNVPVLPDSYGITVDDIEATCSAQGVAFNAGDCVLIRTGFGTYRASDHIRFSTLGAGPTPTSCAWLAERGVILAGSDTMSFEQVPSLHEGHLELMRRKGIPIVKQMNLDALAAESVVEFVFTMLPLRLVGGTASPVNPIAMF